jgi:hypothetical protein
VLSALDEYANRIRATEYALLSASLRDAEGALLSELDARAALLHSLREMAADTARLDWLEGTGRVVTEHDPGRGDEKFLGYEWRISALTGIPRANTIRAAIDRARGVPSSVVPAVDPARSTPTPDGVL